MMYRTLKIAITGALIFAFAGILGFTLLPIQSTSARPLGIILQPDKFPTGSVMLSDGAIKMDESSHPLSRPAIDAKIVGGDRLSVDDQSAISGYETAQTMSVLIPDQGVIMNFSYQFRTREGALKAAKVLRNDIAHASNLVEVQNLRGGKGYLLRGNEGDSVYWFIGTKENSLSLILINGIGQEKVSTLFKSTLQQISGQIIDPVP